MTTVGKNIMKRRKELGMTQEELATRMGYKSKSTINKIELGINDIVQSKVVKFAEVLDTTVGYIMGWEEAIEEKPVETANKLADLFLRIEFDEDEIFDLLSMLEEYNGLPKQKKEQVREYVHLLSGKV